MAVLIESSAERALDVVANLPRSGQVDKELYVTRGLANNGEPIIGLVATWSGAARLAEDPSYRFISLVRNPNLIDEGDAIILKTHQVRDNTEVTTRAVYRNSRLEGEEPNQVQAILNNIGKLRGLMNGNLPSLV